MGFPISLQYKTAPKSGAVFMPLLFTLDNQPSLDGINPDDDSGDPPGAVNERVLQLECLVWNK